MRVFRNLEKLAHSKSGPGKFDLAALRVASPCPSSWEKMVGDERVRHCSECNLNVYNLSAMTEREIEQLVAAHQGGRLCTRLYRRADGTVITQNCPWSLRAMARKASRFASAVLTACMSVTFAMAKPKAPKASCECHHIQQKDSGIRLAVMDPDGALIPGAEITLENKSGKETRAGSTDRAGEWTIGKLAPGEYQLTVRAKGFRAYIGKVNVTDAMLLRMQLKLAIAQATTVVEVESQTLGVIETLGVTAVKHEPIRLFAPGGQRLPMR
jgi:hypothetical protein